MDATKKCKHHGCLQGYTDIENQTEGCCQYHPGWPIFRDTVKKWTCCEVEKWDWEEFMKIPGCARGQHTEEKPVQPSVSAAAPVQVQHGGNVQDINAYNAALEEKTKLQVEASNETQSEGMMHALISEGLYKCANAGCNKSYSPDASSEENPCKYHTGKPIFRDTKKYWSCCGAGSYDWDDFLKLDTCTVGPHVPKMVKASTRK
eukprot:Lankesteria_metandrocarpae@DN884_c0_g1_i1.p1